MLICFLVLQNHGIESQSPDNRILLSVCVQVIIFICDLKRPSGASLLILANKQDLKGALTPDEIAKVLNLENMDKTRH
ncbi:ADP-ribosylation factor-like protein 2 [Manihot esculenta]|uniref:Uncharacterized protein n=1 Tax=Manihot esculenta TaxID=3983 RepID=A0A2C9VKM7_MANES|nr:ADP-ribosylation factor-like protein 2 [Manihot esculenta]